IPRPDRPRARACPGGRRCPDLQVPPVLLAVRLRCAAQVRPGARLPEGGLAPRALQSLEPRRGGLRVIVGSPLTPIEHALRHVLDWLHGTVGLSWAWSIVALTVLVRMLIVPLVVRQIHSMQNLQRHAPQMKEMQRKYKQDKKKQQE